MSFFGNAAINRINLHSAIQALAQGAGGVFLFVYLLRSGVPAPLVMGSAAAMTASRFVLRPVVLLVARRFGVRTGLIAGTLLESATFLLLPEVHGPGPMLLVVIAVSAIGSVFYWTSLHAYSAEMGDAEHRGRQVGAGAAAAAAMTIVAPGAGGLALVALGPAATFSLVAVVQALAVLPLLGAPNPVVSETARLDWPRARTTVALQTADGWFAGGNEVIWNIALFIALGEGFAGYGGAMALAGLAGAVASLVVGRWIDLGHARLWAALAYGVCAVVVVVKAASVGIPGLAVAANALSTVGVMLLTPVMMTRVYNEAKASPCPLRFMMATEGGWDVGCGACALAAAALTAAGAPLSVSILLALGGVAVGLPLLRRDIDGLANGGGGPKRF